MRKVRGFGLLFIVTLTMAMTLGLPWVRETLAEVEVFRVSEVTVEGNRFLTYDEVVEAAAIPIEASLLGDVSALAGGLRAHPGVREVRVKRGLPRRLILSVTEREPVGLIPDGVLVPVDTNGRLLPFDPSRHRMDLPLIQPYRIEDREQVRLTPSQIRAITTELRRLREFDPDLVSSVSEVAMDMAGDMAIHLGQPRVTVRYAAPVTPGRLQEGMRVLSDALERNPEQHPAEIDLRFADQVVVRFPDSGH